MLLLGAPATKTSKSFSNFLNFSPVLKSLRLLPEGVCAGLNLSLAAFGAISTQLSLPGGSNPGSSQLQAKVSLLHVNLGSPFWLHLGCSTAEVL